MHAETGGDIQSSARMREFMVPWLGYHDELRLIARSGDQVWGGIALFRGPDDPPFDEADIAFVGSLSSSVANGLRSGLLASLTETAVASYDGPAVIIVGPDNAWRLASVGAAERLNQLAGNEHNAPAIGIVAAIVARAREFAAGRTPALPRARVRLRTGQWLVLHASPLAGADGLSGDVVVTVEEARPPEIVPIVVAAFDLTPRERDVTQLVLQGVDTKEIASTLHLSTYTVQDHLKSVFEKAGVRSRRELIARIFFDQYVPRLGGDVSHSGFFAQP